MRVLALDTTTRAGSVAIVDDGRVLIEREGDPTRTHALRLPAELLDALAAVGLTTAEIDLFGVASGPGSFTGLRIGIATMQGLAFVHRRRIAAVSRAPGPGRSRRRGPSGGRPGRRLDGCASARRLQRAVRDRRAVRWHRCHADRSRGPDRRAASDDARAVVTCSACPRRSAATGRRSTRSLLPGLDRGHGDTPPLAATIARLALVAARDGTTVAPAGVQPLYVRRPDAKWPGTRPDSRD